MSGKDKTTTFAVDNQRRPHTALADETPDEVYFDNLPALAQTAEANNRRTPLMKMELLSKQPRPFL